MSTPTSIRGHRRISHRPERRVSDTWKVPGTHSIKQESGRSVSDTNVSAVRAHSRVAVLGHTPPEPPLKMGSDGDSVVNAAIQPPPASRLLARSNRSAAGQASTSGARARGFCPLLWSRGPRPTTGLRSHTPPLGLCGVGGWARVQASRHAVRFQQLCSLNMPHFGRGSTVEKALRG